MGETRAWTRWGRWLLVGLAWQVLGLTISLALSLSLDNFHALIHRLVLGVMVTNGLALLGGGFLAAYFRYWHRPLAHPLLRVPVVLIGLAIATYLSTHVAVAAGRDFCRMDGFQVDRWHLTLVLANAMLLVSVGLVCGLVVVHGRLSAGLAREVRENERLERVQLETQLAALQSKVNPHFLFNTLNTIVDLVRTDPDRVEKLVLSLSDIYRRVLALPDTSGVSLAEEIDLVEHYLSVEKVRMGSRLTYSIEVDDAVRHVVVPPLAVEILAENAIRHGLAPRKEGGTLRIAAVPHDGLLRVEVIDDGVGVSGHIRGTGFGLLSVRQRLDLFYGGRGRLEIAPAEGQGTRSVLEIPLGD